jgi:hypothetical protein
LPYKYGEGTHARQKKNEILCFFACLIVPLQLESIRKNEYKRICSENQGAYPVGKSVGHAGRYCPLVYRCDVVA